jgi:DNA invertase Pin-like site-specific DNA recombinase
MTEYVAYYRVSTDRQGASGLGLDAQRAAVARHIGVASSPLAEFTEIESGKRHANRPQLLAALDACRRSRAVLVIARLDRLARNVAFISNLMESGVEFLAVDMPTANRLTIHILAAVAEHEREMISQRTKAALAQAKARGTKLGNPNALAVLPAARAIAAAAYPPIAPEIRDLIARWRSEGKTLRTIADNLNRLAIRTPRGKTWYASSVRNMLCA